MAKQEHRVVVDSSVAVKWFASEEPDSDIALSLRNDHVSGKTHLWASDILQVEVINALRFKKEYKLKELIEAVRVLHGIGLNVSRTDEDTLIRAVEIALKGSVTVYDSLPVAVAELKGMTCVTADQQTQYGRLRPKGYPITLLSSQNKK
jgi:predicted nucleic acid-binding protein